MYKLKTNFFKKVFSLIFVGFICIFGLVMKISLLNVIFSPIRYKWISLQEYNNLYNESILTNTNNKVYNIVFKESIPDGYSYYGSGSRRRYKYVYHKTSWILFEIQHNNIIYRIPLSKLNKEFQEYKEKLNIYHLSNMNMGIIEFNSIQDQNFKLLDKYSNSKSQNIFIFFMFLIINIIIFYEFMKIIFLKYTDYESFVDLINNNPYRIFNIKLSIFNKRRSSNFSYFTLYFIYNKQKYYFYLYDENKFNELKYILNDKFIDYKMI